MNAETVVMRGVTAGYGDRVALRDLDLDAQRRRMRRPGRPQRRRQEHGDQADARPHPPQRRRVSRCSARRRPPAAARAGATKSATCPKTIALYPSLTGAETLAFYAQLKRRPVAANAALLERVGLAAAAHRRVGSYSKGMRQRLGLAQALLGEPRLLLLDEPTTGLDPAVRQNFYEILRDLRRDGATILLSSHALAELEGEVDRVVVRNQGRKIVDGSIAELRTLAAIRPRVRLRLSRLPSPLGEPAAWTEWTPTEDGRLEAACDENDLAAMLRNLPAFAQEVEILRPSLDELYAKFQTGAI